MATPYRDDRGFLSRYRAELERPPDFQTAAIDVLAARVGRIVGALLLLVPLAFVGLFHADARFVYVAAIEPGRHLAAWLARIATRALARRRLAAGRELTGHDEIRWLERAPQRFAGPARRLGVVASSLALLAWSGGMISLSLVLVTLTAVTGVPFAHGVLLTGLLAVLGGGQLLATVFLAPVVVRSWRRPRSTEWAWALGTVLAAGLPAFIHPLCGLGGLVAVGLFAFLVPVERQRFLAEEDRLAAYFV